MLRDFFAKQIERILDRYTVNMKAEEERLSAAGITVVTDDQYAVLKSLGIGDMIRLNGEEYPVPHRFLFFKGTRGVAVPIVSLEIPALGFHLTK